MISLLQRTAKFGVAVVLAVLLLSIAVSAFQGSVTTQANLSSASADSKEAVKLSYGGLSLSEHKMSQSELKAYKNDLGVYQQGQNYNQLVDGHGTGLAPPTTVEWKDIAANAYVVDSVSYKSPPPSAVDESATPWFPPIGNQGQQGSCASWAVGYYCKTFQEAKEHQWNLTGAKWVGGGVASAYQSEVMSPAFLYNLINGGVDSGSDFETAIELVCNVGISSWQTMPYDQSNYTVWPSTVRDRSAQLPFQQYLWVLLPIHKHGSGNDQLEKLVGYRQLGDCRR